MSWRNGVNENYLGIARRACTHGFHGVTDIDHLLEQFALLLMSSRGIDNDDIETFWSVQG